MEDLAALLFFLSLTVPPTACEVEEDGIRGVCVEGDVKERIWSLLAPEGR